MATPGISQSLERARLYKQHGLLDDAKKECILIVTAENGKESAIATAYYLLGSISFETNQVGTALETWQVLLQDYPESAEAKEVSERIEELSQVVGETQREAVGNAVAQSYLRNGDFWSRGKSTAFTIDSSWIPNVEAANKWYDKVIQEFPSSVAARMAYEEKMRTLLGWAEVGRHGSRHGVKADPDRYLPILVATFQEYEEGFPDSGSLQGFRYQIAQAYWRAKNWAKTREWLNLIISSAQSADQDSFYIDLAHRRLQKIEY